MIRFKVCTSRSIFVLAGPQLDLPHNVSPANLETLLNGLMQQSENQPYSFFIEEQQLTDDLGTFLQDNKVDILLFLAFNIDSQQNASEEAQNLCTPVGKHSISVKQKKVIKNQTQSMV